MTLTDDQKRFLTTNYFNALGNGSYSGVDKFYRFIRQEDVKISRKDLQEWLQDQPSYSLFKAVRKKVPRPSVIVPFKFFMLDADTLNLSQYADSNDGYKYVAVFIDILSHYLFTFPMKTLTAAEMKSKLQLLLKEVHPYMVRSDRGGEYKGQAKKYLSDQRIKLVNTSEYTKANYAERVIHTLRLKIARYMRHNHTREWYKALPLLTESYNKTYHRTIKRSPAEALQSEDTDLWQVQYEPEFNKTALQTKSYVFNIGDVVRISKIAGTFDKESDPKWTEELFTIYARRKNQGIPRYDLKDFNNEPISDSFLTSELQKVNITSDTAYEIEKVLRTRKIKGKKQALIRWKGWGPQFDSWIDADTITNYSA